MALEADDLDRAAELTQRANDAAIEEAKRRNKAEQAQNPDGTWPVTQCVDCEDVLTHLRMSMGRIRCVYCQTEIEALRKRGL